MLETTWHGMYWSGRNVELLVLRIMRRSSLILVQLTLHIRLPKVEQIIGKNFNQGMVIIDGCLINTYLWTISRPPRRLIIYIYTHYISWLILYQLNWLAFFSKNQKKIKLISPLHKKTKKRSIRYKDILHSFIVFGAFCHEILWNIGSKYFRYIKDHKV